MISSASSKRPMTWSSGSPNAWACLPACPEPSPKTNRPPLISSSVSTALAVIAGLRCRADRIQVPTFTREVAAATAPVIATLSHQPWIDPSVWRHSSSSGIQTVSKPIASAPEGQVADLDPARGRPVRPRFLHREHEAEFDGPHGTSLAA